VMFHTSSSFCAPHCCFSVATQSDRPALQLGLQGLHLEVVQHLRSSLRQASVSELLQWLCVCVCVEMLSSSPELSSAAAVVFIVVGMIFVEVLLICCDAAAAAALVVVPVPPCYVSRVFF